MSYYTLQLQPSLQHPRELCLKVTLNQLFAWLYVPSMGESGASTVYTSAYAHECRLDKFDQRYSLWMRTTSFELSADEATKVQTLIDNHFPTARSPIGPEPAKVASTAVASLNSASREPLTSAMSDVSALDNATAVKALTANEDY